MDVLGAFQESAADPIDNHAAERWASAVASLRRAQRDVRTISEWGRAIGVSGGALREWCQVARVSPRRTLLLARLLRAVTHSANRPWRPEQRLDIVDRRTLKRVLMAGGLPLEADGVTVADLLARQTLVTDPYALIALRRAVSADALTGRGARSDPDD